MPPRRVALSPLKCFITQLKRAIKPCLSLLFRRLNKFSSLIISLYVICSSPLLILVAVYWTGSSLSKTLFSLETPNWKQPCKCEGEGNKLCFQPPVCVYISTAQDVFGFPCCQDTPLTPVRLVHSTHRSFSAELLSSRFCISSGGYSIPAARLCIFRC